MAITEVPDWSSRAAAGSAPLIAADHRGCVSANRAPTVRKDGPPVPLPNAVGMGPWPSDAAMATEIARLPTIVAAAPTAKLGTAQRVRPMSTITAARQQIEANVHGSQ